MFNPHRRRGFELWLGDKTSKPIDACGCATPTDEKTADEKSTGEKPTGEQSADAAECECNVWGMWGFDEGVLVAAYFRPASTGASAEPLRTQLVWLSELGDVKERRIFSADQLRLRSVLAVSPKGRVLNRTKDGVELLERGGQASWRWAVPAGEGYLSLAAFSDRHLFVLAVEQRQNRPPLSWVDSYASSVVRLYRLNAVGKVDLVRPLAEREWMHNPDRGRLVAVDDAHLVYARTRGDNPSPNTLWVSGFEFKE